MLGTDTTEVRRVTNMFASSAVAVGLIELAFELSFVPPWVSGVIPACWALCLVARYVLRKLLHRRRCIGRCQLPVLAVGSTASVADLIADTPRDPQFGWRVDAACTSTGSGDEVDGVPVIGDLDDVVGAVEVDSYHAVAVAPTPASLTKGIVG